jgi:hypothetical protein
MRPGPNKGAGEPLEKKRQKKNNREQFASVMKNAKVAIRPQSEGLRKKSNYV